MPPVKRPQSLKPFWQTTDGETVRLYHGHVIDVLKQLPSESIQCCVTSPPYWGLRDYKTGTWEGGSPECDHVEREAKDAAKTSMLGPKRHLGVSLPETNAAYKSTARQFAEQCKKCGATRIDQQLGSEATPEEFIQNMVLVFREVRRVLRDDGVLWLNLGDSYSAGGRTGEAPAQTVANGNRREHAIHRVNGGLPGGNLIGIPWRTALALQEDGWVLRSDIPWVKRSSMPESVTNRPAKSLEYVFLLTKSMKYFYDHVAVRRSGKPESASRYEYDFGSGAKGTEQRALSGTDGGAREFDGNRNFRNSDLWFQSVDGPHGMTGVGDEIVGLDVTTRGYEGAHFACYPPDLIQPMILAGTSAHGACVKCGAPWKRVTEEEKVTRDRPNDYVKRTGEEGTGNSCSNSVAGVNVKTLGWAPTCNCGTKEVRPCRVLDTFIGSGTTCAVSIEHGLWSWGIDLSEDYLKDNAIPRIEGALLRRHATSGLTGKGPKKMVMGTSAPIKQ